MSSLEIKYVPTNSLIPYSRNPRKWDKGNAVQKMVSSIKEFGFTIPILAKPDNTIIDGHLRYAGAKQLKMAEVPVIIADGWTEAQVKAFRLLANRSVNWAEWDDELLRLELEELQGLNFDLDLTGFDTADLSRLLEAKPEQATDGDGDSEEAAEPELPANPVTRPLDLWILGNHRLLCADSTDQEAVWEVLDGQKADLCFTSPPYLKLRDYHQKISDSDALLIGVFKNVVEVMKPDGQVLVNLGVIYENYEWTPYWEPMIESFREQGWKRYGLYVWDRGWALPGAYHGRLAPRLELIFHFNQQKRMLNKVIPCKEVGETGANNRRFEDGSLEDRDPIVVGEYKVLEDIVCVARSSTSTSETGNHPAVFPVKLPQVIIETFTNPGELVLEPFSGSGTSIIAAEKSSRRCAGIEIAPPYVDAAVLRWQNITGQEATLQETGETFAEVSKRRLLE